MSKKDQYSFRDMMPVSTANNYLNRNGTIRFLPHRQCEAGQTKIRGKIMAAYIIVISNLKINAVMAVRYYYRIKGDEKRRFIKWGLNTR